MTNTNCLENIKCPACGNEDSFRIAAKTVAIVTDDGTEDHGDMQWDDSSYAECSECHRHGTLKDFRAIDIDAYLAARRQIATVWSVEDVQEIRPDLTEDQCWEVLEQAKKHHDAGIGINWSVLECHAEMLFGNAPAAAKADEE